jgi:hypothetical protein
MDFSVSCAKSWKWDKLWIFGAKDVLSNQQTKYQNFAQSGRWFKVSGICCLCGKDYENYRQKSHYYPMIYYQ